MTRNRWSDRRFTPQIQSVAFLVGLGSLLAGFVSEAAAVDDRTKHWSFQKPARPAVPSKAELKFGKRVRNPVDAFILRKLEQQRLSPAAVADKHMLVRRAYFDLLGLPPTPQQVAKFVNDKSPDAWQKLIDELLKSKHYGERWGRHWLDVARYADSGGYETDIYWRNAWRYRDYVVKSLNDDKPYDRFVQEQIAGDEIWPDNLDLDPRRVYHVSEQKRRHLEAWIGTGFFTLGPMVHESGLDAMRLRHEWMTDWVDTTGSVFLGLTIGCARCHEHKFDPIAQRDYYAMQAIFAGSRMVEVPLLTAMEVADWRQHYPRIIAVDEARRAYRLFEKQTSGRKLSKADEQRKQQLLIAIAQEVLKLPGQAAGVPNSKYDGLMEVPTASVLSRERAPLIKTVRLLERGELSQPRQPVAAAVPAVLAKATGRKPSLGGPFESRKAFALWLTRPDHPLTARVMVNRLWHWHVGQGLVATPNDFGKNGQPPTHPELLDWLASEFVARRWSIKAMHRLIMNSATYRMSSRFGPVEQVARDPDNRLLWRMNRRRLEAEALWDAVHSVAGTINLQMGGRPVVPPLAADEIASLRNKWHWVVTADPAQHTRRGIYIMVRRNFKFPMFDVFDTPVTAASCPVRDVTTVAPQALWGLNNKSVFRQAIQFAGRVAKRAGKDRKGQVDLAWRIALGRAPSADESQSAVALLQVLTAKSSQPLTDPPASLKAIPPAEGRALAKLCLALFNLTEFAFVD